MDKETVQLILDFISKYAEVLGTQAFQITYKKVMFDATFNFVLGILLLIVSVIFAYKYYQHAKKQYEKEYRGWDGEDVVLYSVIPVIIILVIAGFGIHFMYSGMSGLVNPEYHTIMRLRYLIR